LVLLQGPVWVVPIWHVQIWRDANTGRGVLSDRLWWLPPRLS